MLVFDSFIDSLGTFGAWLGLSSRATVATPGCQPPPTSEGDEDSDSLGCSHTSESTPPPGFFANSSNFVIQQAAFTSINVLTNGNTVLQHLAPYTDPRAAVDSSARWPPPSCHPGTRVSIVNNLMSWLDDSSRLWNFIWLHGSAGCGKSAIAQTFAEKCSELGRLGAAFFFSRPNKRSDPKTVIPSLAYQLATNCPAYKTIIASQLSDDPQLLSKALPVQFRKLIIEPFAYLQHQGDTSVQQPFLILLDGLDECHGELAQCEFVKLISETVRVKKNLPLIWLICCRPEAHFRYIFSRIVYCYKWELEIDEECRNDVDRYLRDEFYELQCKYNIDSLWPPAERFAVISGGASGHFAFADTAIGYVGDEEYANPVQRLDELIAFIQHFELASVTNPLARLDLLYKQILSEIPDDIFPITWRIFGHLIYVSNVNCQVMHLTKSAQILCNYLDVDQGTFYSALRRLYSVVFVPSPEDALDDRLWFYHASFQDFLCDKNRSGKFFIERDRAIRDIEMSLLHWHEVDALYFHRQDEVSGGRRHDHQILPGLKWATEANGPEISRTIAGVAEESYLRCATYDPDLRARVSRMDMRYLFLDFGDFQTFINVCHEEGELNGFCRTEPSNEYDAQLLNYLERMTYPEVVMPASLPLTWPWKRKCRLREYLLLGHGTQSIVVWVTEHVRKRHRKFRFDRLTCDREPSSNQVSDYREWLREVGWYNDDDDEEEEENGDETE
ncbi:hypothetical protein NP233_g8052 [Leucocoprinus birnbaumii]|uniref:Nephrocystin 3-like N-terminal domain-containing protein n=1 Tax=Leucocoprinus birnbaumii TaxID=56174 RepID=A0AAD5YS81_9AGAR|nr:hypothetical protein NP233_g8052 [Leucocoprinus birnbaumii]